MASLASGSSSKKEPVAMKALTASITAARSARQCRPKRPSCIGGLALLPLPVGGFTMVPGAAVDPAGGPALLPGTNTVPAGGIALVPGANVMLAGGFALVPGTDVVEAASPLAAKALCGPG